MTSENYLSMSIDQLAQQSPVPLIILPNQTALLNHFAETILDEIRQNNQQGKPTRVIFPVGPRDHYPILAERTNREQLSWRKVTIFQMDEYLDWQGRYVPLDHPLSFRRFMADFIASLAPSLRPRPNQIHVPDPERLNALAKAIERVGGIDTCYGGVGIHGHVAFNEPFVALLSKVTNEQFRDSCTRIVPLTADTIVQTALRQLGGDFYAVPPMAITIGMGEIRAARRIRLYCDGGVGKRAALRRILFEPPSVAWPATLLRDHPDLAIVTDRNTALPPF